MLESISTPATTQDSGPASRKGMLMVTLKRLRICFAVAVLAALVQVALALVGDVSVWSWVTTVAAVALTAAAYMATAERLLGERHA